MALNQPAPLYDAAENLPSQLGDKIKQFKVNRKPIASESYNSEPQHEDPLNINFRGVSPTLPPQQGLSVRTSIQEAPTNSSLYSGPPRTHTDSAKASTSPAYINGARRTESFAISPSATSTASMDSTSSKSSTSSQMKKAYEEARHFAGGLISRPCESTKHFTILRHSHGLVFYQGSSTSLAISIFSDAPLPPGRTLWLQSKGWTGKTGMKAKAFVGRNSYWLDVTPTLLIGSEQLNPTDERAWQRDFQKFRKKAPVKIRDRHQLRETAIVRIPVEAGDGYFHLVLCTPDKKKIFCNSPTFRVLSTSMKPSSIRGSSLSTLPLEFGAMVLAAYGRGTVGTTVSAVASPFQSQVQQYMPSFWTREAASAAYEVSRVQRRIDMTAKDADRRYEMTLEESLAIAEAEELALEEGPKAPYPINFVGTYDGVANHSEQLSLVIINLAVPENISHKLHGYYFGWARQVSKKQKSKTEFLSVEKPWVQAMISATLVDTKQLTNVSIGQANQKIFTIHIISESEDEISSNFEKLEIRLMGFIRPDEPLQRMHLDEGLQAGEDAAAEASILAEVNDISRVQDILGHPSWAADYAERELAQKGTTERMEKLKKGYADTRMVAQKHIDRVPFNKAGVRVPGDAMRDRSVIVNGFYVMR